MAQAFGEDLVVPYLRRFAARCETEGVKAPKSSGNLLYDIEVLILKCLSTGACASIRFQGTPYIPPPESTGGSVIRCYCPTRVQKDGSDYDFDNDPTFWREASIVASQYDSPGPEKSVSQEVPDSLGMFFFPHDMMT
jgi:hypothetical protein